MKISIKLLLVLCLFCSVKAQVKLSDHLKSLEPFVGKTWKGEFTNSTSGEPVKDISKWEYALNGKAVRILHSVNDGTYGGETIIFWDKEKESLVFFYFTTEGFFTKGNVKVENDELVAHEFVTGNKDGITEVKSISKILTDGRMHNKSQLLKNGEWVDGHEIFYSEDSEAEVKFKDILK